MRWASTSVHFCGLSKGGMVGQWLGAHHGERLLSLALCATAARLGPPELWSQRIDLSAREGMAALVDAVCERWFTAAFRREPDGPRSGRCAP